MKTAARFITTLALALTAIGTWAVPYTFTAGTDIPLDADFATYGNCTPESDGYSIGSTGGSTTLTLALVNSEAGDYILTVLGGAKQEDDFFAKFAHDNGVAPKQKVYLDILKLVQKALKA